MSMLAERKQKQRWSLNPRGKHWSEDVNKFGHKMLEKMGWSAGKGLGAKEDGITEHVKVSYKNDAKGMGFKDNGELWTKHEDNFTSLLANLGSGSDAKKITLPQPEKSLEKKSQSSKARVHYKKFTRGKDLASRSEKDIANIFGRKTLERTEQKQSNEEIVENGIEDKSYGVVTVKAGNMTDYFKSKLGKLGNMTSSKTDYALNDHRDDYESEIGACVGFGFASVKENQEQTGTPTLGVNQINFVASGNNKTKEETPTKMETNKKRKRCDSEDWTEVVSKKKKKSKKKQMAFDNLGSDINPAEEVCYDNPCLKQTDSPVELKNNDGKGKKKRVTFSSPITEFLNKSDDSSKPEKSKKKKKNKQLTNGIDNLGCEDNSFEESNQLSSKINEKKIKKKKKPSSNGDGNSVNVTQVKKKRKHEEVGIDNLACAEISVNEKNEEIKRYKLKKKAMEHGLVNPACEASNVSPTALKEKQKKTKQNGIDNVSFEGKTIPEKPKVQKKKNKKQKNNSLEMSIENISDVLQNNDGTKTKKNIKKKNKITAEDNAESPSKKLKKKNKNKKSGIENLACEINTVEENIASINNEIDDYQTELENEINVKKAKKQKKQQTQNPKGTSKKGQKQNSPNQKSKPNSISNNQQSTNDERNFQKNSKFKKKSLGNNHSGQKLIDNTFENGNKGFGKRHSFENMNNNFGNRHNNFVNGNNRNNHFNGSNNFNRRSFDGPNNFNRRSFSDQGGFNNSNRNFNNQGGFNNSNRNNFNNQGGFNNFNKVDKTSLKNVIKPGELKLHFPGSNIKKLLGYGVAADAINKKIRPEPEPEPEPEQNNEM